MGDQDSVRRLALSCLLLGFTGPVPPRWLLDAFRGSASPGAAALGHLDEPDSTQDVYRAIGARCAAAGVTLDLAPVADVNVDPRNPVIGLRAFAADGRVAARHVAAAVRGIQAAGVAVCLKYFPGHGATRADSHHEIATVDRTRAELDAVELAAFGSGIGAGARAVMTGHLLVPALDPTAITTLGRPITTGVPLVAPGLIATGVYGWVLAWNEFVIANTLLLDNTKRTLMVYLLQFQSSPTHGADYGGLMAAATLTALPVVVLFVILQSRISTGLTSGAVKG